MTDFLPLFPLQLVVFPGEKVNLHIFEPRYKQLMRECEENSVTFGIPPFLNEKVMRTGTELRLLSIEKRYENGEMDVRTEGVGLFSIEQFYQTAPKKLYAGADIQRLEFDELGDPVLAQKIVEQVQQLFKLLNISKDIPPSHQLRTYDLAHHVGFSSEQEYEFLCVLDELSRQELMLQHLEQLLPMVDEMERLKARAQMNGHFKNIQPPDF